MAIETCENDRYRCVALVRYTRINETTVILYRRAPCETSSDKEPYEIEIDPDGLPPRDIRDKYKDPVIKEGKLLEVRVYDEDAIDLNNRQTLMGDFSTALARCEDALDAKGYTVFQP